MKIPVDQILRMSVAERLELIGVIWDSIEDSAERALITPAQKAEIERRIGLYRQDPERTSSWDAVRERLERDE